MANNRFISFFREFIYNPYTRAALNLTFPQKNKLFEKTAV